MNLTNHTPTMQTDYIVQRVYSLLHNAGASTGNMYTSNWAYTIFIYVHYIIRHECNKKV